MKKLLQDLRQLKAGLERGQDFSDMAFESAEIAGLAKELMRRYGRLDTKAKAESRRLKGANASLERARSEKEQYKSSFNELQKILDLCRVISSSQNLDDILRQLLFLLSEILPSRGCAVYVGRDGSPGNAPVLASNFTPRLQAILAQHFEEGIIRWILDERRVCLIPSFEDPSHGGEDGDFAVIPLGDNDSAYGFVWLACTIPQEEVTQETTTLIWVLSCHASIAILNCLHRQRMEEKINELQLLTSVNELKGKLIMGEIPRDDADAGDTRIHGSLPAFYRELRHLVSRELRLEKAFLIAQGPEGRLQIFPTHSVLSSRDFLDLPDIVKLLRQADREQVHLEAGDFFLSAHPRTAQAIGTEGMVILSLAPGEAQPAYLLLGLAKEDLQRLPMLQSLFMAIASQSKVVAENISLYDSLLAANRNLTALQWQLVHSGKLAALGQLAGGVAHEINNPLQIMLGRIQMIQMLAEGRKGGAIPRDDANPLGNAIPRDDANPPDDDKLRDELTLITEEILRIRDIVRNLLDFSRQGKRETSFTPVSVVDILRDVLALLQHQLLSNQVEVKLDLDPRCPQVVGNRNQLKQVFINLMMNAIHAMEKEPKVLEVSCRLLGDMIVATVRDSGIGIPQGDILRIFEPFFSTKSTGTGLGLSISYGLIKDHKGTIEVESQESRGTCFTVRLPKPSEEALGYNQMVG